MQPVQFLAEVGSVNDGGIQLLCIICLKIEVQTDLLLWV